MNDKSVHFLGTSTDCFNIYAEENHELLSMRKRSLHKAQANLIENDTSLYKNCMKKLNQSVKPVMENVLSIT